MIEKRFKTRVGAEGWISTLLAKRIQFAVKFADGEWIVSYPAVAVYDA